MIIFIQYLWSNISKWNVCNELETNKENKEFYKEMSKNYWRYISKNR